jgi:hypothetical protein
MDLTKIGNELWDFVDATGSETRLPESEAPAVILPTRWRLFGPLETHLFTNAERVAGAPDATAVVQSQKTVPDTLEIGHDTFEAQEFDFDGDTLDLGKDFGRFETVFFQDLAGRSGQQAYAFAELEVSEEIEITVGAGSDYWMQWWIDGESVCDTVENGNGAHPPSSTDHTFTTRLSAGRHLLGVWLISGQASWILKAGVMTARDSLLASITFSDSWQFLPDLGEIRPPRRDAVSTGGTALEWGHTMAIAADRCLSDETIECNFQMAPEGNFGVILGARDSGHYYTVQIPRWGQLWRGRGFWACICKADGSGYLRILKMQLMPNVVCHWNAWLKLKVERRGNRIQMWVDGVKGPGVTDDTYGPGCAGLTGFAKYIVRDLKIDGTPAAGPEWPTGDHRGKPWFLPVPDTDQGDLQDPQGGKMIKLSDNEILLAMPICKEGSDATYGTPPDELENRALCLFLSQDNGRTWSPHGTVKDEIPGRWINVGPGQVRALHHDPIDFELSYSDSTDKGQTWSKPVACTLLGDWHEHLLKDRTWNGIYGHTTLNDGTLMMVILHGYLDLKKVIPNQGGGTWGTEVAQPYCTLSTDQGLSWSEPVPMDNAALNDGDRPDAPCGGFAGTSVAQLPGGRIVALARPFHSPFMWQTHSDDGGKTWRMACYAPFSGAGGVRMVATRSGYLVNLKRGPAVCVHISTDGGVNWDEGTIIDYPASFNGAMLEVEPDVVLILYPESMGEFRPSFVRCQLIRITPEGPVPVER